MDTHGHESIAEETGKPVLKKALNLAGRSGWNLQAFYLGNWITDVNQGVDPVAYEGGRTKLLNAYDYTLGSIQKALSAATDVPILQSIPGIRKANQGLKDIRIQLVNALEAIRGGRSSDMGKALFKIFKVKGYYKFSHPEQRGGPMRMRYNVYRHVFHNRFTQYYPHEHLDRFPGELDANGGYSNKLAKRSRTIDGPPGTGSRLAPHLYYFLCDDLEIVAGLLAEIDMKWARDTFTKNSSKWQSDEDPEWNLWLAKLGHAVHACEDFFAHSNFVEQAIGDPVTPQRKSMPRMSDGNQFLKTLGFDTTSTDSTGPWMIFRRRLKRLNGYRDAQGVWRYHTDMMFFDWQTLPEEDHVVTGYFDFTDTFFSLKHVGEEILGPPASGAQTSPPLSHYVEEGVKFTKLMRAICYGVERRSLKRGDRELTQAAAKRDAEALLKEFANSHPDPHVREAAASVDGKLPAEAATDIRNEFLDGVGLMLKHSSGSYSLFTAIIFWMDLQANLLRFGEAIGELVPDLMPDWIKEWWKEKVTKPVSQSIMEFTGRYRIGSHSLIAKDYEWENSVLDQIYSRAMNCAKAVHWYVIRTMTRAVQPKELPVCRADKDEERAVNTVNSRHWIDWLELIEFFLRHPYGQPQSSPLRQLTENKRWWWNIVRKNDWNALPGYNGVEMCRDPSLPHRWVYMNRTDVEDMIQCSNDTMRDQAEHFYDDSLKGGNKPPKHRPHKRTEELPTDEPASIPPPDPPRNLATDLPKQFLPSDDDVRLLQQLLHILGHNPPDNIDGFWGSVTKESVKGFQRANPPLAVDGVYGPNTRIALGKALNQLQPQNTTLPR